MTSKIGINWHLRFREEIAQLKEELELTQMWLNKAERKLKKYEKHKKSEKVHKIFGAKKYEFILFLLKDTGLEL